MAWSTVEEFLAYVRAIPDGALFPVQEAGTEAEAEQEALVSQYLESSNRRLIYDENYSFPEVDDDNPAPERMKDGEMELALDIYKGRDSQRQDTISKGVKTFRIGNFSETYLDTVAQKELWDIGGNLPERVKMILSLWLVSRESLGVGQLVITREC